LDVRLSPEQTALRDSVRRVVADLGARAVGELDDEPRRDALDRAATAAGWRELRSAADPAGGPWASGVEVGLVAEALAAGAADVAFIGPTLAAELRRRAGAPSGSRTETILLTGDLSRLALEGEPAVAFDAHGASSALALAPHEGGWALTTTAIDRVGSRVDLTRASGTPTGATSRVPGQRRLLDADDLARVRVLGLAAATADLLGTMDGAVRLAVGHATERRQYGRAVGSFQAVQHLLADAHALTEGARSAAVHAWWAVDSLPVAEAVAAASAAKAYTARSARSVCETAIQVHGGIGNTWECMAHVYLRRALTSIDLFGGIHAGLLAVLAHHGIEG
jgi:alkylation response protein AidB-like acyl-CoA dehydrogenase